MNEADLEDALFHKAADRGKGKIIPDWSYINQELKRKGVTLRLLWQECYQSDQQREIINLRVQSSLVMPDLIRHPDRGTF